MLLVPVAVVIIQNPAGESVHVCKLGTSKLIPKYLLTFQTAPCLFALNQVSSHITLRYKS